MGDSLPPIIVRRKKVIAAEGHHGGAWKVAYADFVTAMMAFFLLMWLLNATTEKQRKGLADYFSSTIPISRISGGGEGSLFGEDIYSELRIAKTGDGATEGEPTGPNLARGDESIDLTSPNAPSLAERSLAESQYLMERLKARGGESMAMLMEMRHVVTRVSDEGLIVEISDSDEMPLWERDSGEALPLLEQTLATVADVLRVTTNGVAVNAHLSSRPIVLARNPIWNLSAERAETARRILEAGGLAPARIQRVSGHADRQPVDRNPMDIRNNRLEVVVLRHGL